MVMLKAGRVFCSGEPRQVMTIENIKSVYGVESEIISSNGHPYILPTMPVNEQERAEN
jgi:ABC-type cobalamin/Fe3+-siderophores transport system ATPase subunit